jgi:hypothetical protein
MLFLAGSCDQGQFNFRGAVWSLAGGLAGALGSFGIILAFTYGATPLYVMPLVFGGAPVINTLVAVVASGSADLPSAPFFVGLIIVACGAVIVLAFAPVNPPHKQP